MTKCPGATKAFSLLRCPLFRVYIVPGDSVCEGEGERVYSL